MRKFIVLAVASLAIGTLPACEEAGENIDNALEEADGGPRDLKDGPMEKAGEAVDNTLGVDRKDGADSLGDAVDGDPSTKPD
jgi:hypothetical protein